MKTSDRKTNVPLKTIAGLLTLTLFLGCSKPKDETPAPTVQATPALSPAPAPAAETATAAAPAVAATAPAAAPVEPAAPATPPGMVRYEAQATGSSTKIEGDSTMHKWTMESKILGGYIEADEKFPEAALTDANVAKPTVYAFMPVRSFKSYQKKMDDVMQDSMNAPQHPRIEFKLIELKPKSSAGAAGVLVFEATGALTISGTTRTNTIPVTIEKKDGKLKINGSAPIKMSDYAVKMKLTGLGSLMSVDDNVKITFEWQVAPKAK